MRYGRLLTAIEPYDLELFVSALGLAFGTRFRICLQTDKQKIKGCKVAGKKIEIEITPNSTMNSAQKRSCPCEDSIDLFKLKPSDVKEAYLANLEARLFELADSDFEENSSEESSSSKSSESDDEISEENSCVNQQEDKMEISEEEQKTEDEASNEEDGEDLDSFVVSDDASISYYSSSEE